MMIGTITLNPSVDRRYTVEDFKSNSMFRCDDYAQSPGGKGINVAKVLNQLGIDVECMGYLGGYGGDFIRDSLQSLGIGCDSFTRIGEETRTCIAIVNNDSQTEILEKGPVIKDIDYKALVKNYKSLLPKLSLVIASGSVPLGLNSGVYRELISMAEKEGVRFILDTSEQYMLEGIKARPYIIKPNIDELRSIVGRELISDGDIIKAARELIDMGALNVAVSMGKDGMIYVTSDKAYRVKIPSIQVQNPVGSGDSTVAGLAYGITSGWDIQRTLAFANACGISNAMCKNTGYIDKQEINEIIKEICVNII